MSNKRKICVVVTARPSYSRIKTALKAIQNHPALELQLVVAASALLDRYGTAVNYIENDGFQIAARVFNVLEGESLVSMAKTTGLGILELSTVFNQLHPDCVVTVADRFETMATAIAASYMNIPLVHVQGGEVTGNIDEKVRHAITKLADIHLVSSQKAAERVIKMGENPDKVKITGCPSIDIAAEILDDSKIDFDIFEKYGGVGEGIDMTQGYMVMMQHPVTTEYKQSRAHIEETLYALHQLGKPTLVFWPNVDAGADGTSSAIRTFREIEKPKQMHFFKNMHPSDFLKLIYNATCLVGNSSVGIREAGFLGIPVVNIGTRQEGREKAANVVDTGYDREQIFSAVQAQVAHGIYHSDRTYGDGNAGQRIADILSEIEFTFDKKLAY